MARRRRFPIMDKLRGNDNRGKPRMSYALRVWWMTDAQLSHETEQKIWLSAYSANNPRSDYHWHVDVCYVEWLRRGNANGYDEAYKQASGTM